MKHTWRCSRALVLLFTLLGPSDANAAPSTTGGKIRVSVETEVFSWTRAAGPGGVSLSGLQSNATRSHEFGFGPGRPVSIDGRPAGGGSVIALGVGYGIHKNLILGGRLGMNLAHSFERADDPTEGVNDDSTTRFLGTFTPYLEILPIPEGRILPFILARTGLSGGTTKTRDGDTWTRVGSILPLVGVGVGAHAFITKIVSIDFGATFDYRWIYSRGTIGGPGNPGQSGGWARIGHSFTLAAVLGLTTWF